MQVGHERMGYAETNLVLTGNCDTRRGRQEHHRRQNNPSFGIQAQVRDQLVCGAPYHELV